MTTYQDNKLKPDSESAMEFPTGKLSRRNAIASIIGTVGAISVFGSGGQVLASNSPSLPPALELRLREAQANSANQALLFVPDEGLVVGFGNSLYRFDLVSGNYSLFRGNVCILSGTSVQTSDNGIFTLTDIVTAADGKSVQTVLVVEKIDQNNNFQIRIAAGSPNQAPTFELLAMYNFCMGYFPGGFEVSGTLPDFDYSPISFVTNVITSRPLGRLIFDETQGPGQPQIELPGTGGIAPPVEKAVSCSETCAAAEAAIVLAADLSGTRFEGPANQVADTLYTLCRDCMLAASLRRARRRRI